MAVYTGSNLANLTEVIKHPPLAKIDQHRSVTLAEQIDIAGVNPHEQVGRAPDINGRQAAPKVTRIGPVTNSNRKNRRFIIDDRLKQAIPRRLTTARSPNLFCPEAK